MSEFKVEVIKASRELTAREKIQLKDTSACISLDRFSQENPDAVIGVEGYVVLAIHNERAKGDTDYEQLVILSDTGDKYITGSNAFRSSFLDIYEEMQADPDPWGIEEMQADPDPWGIKVIRKKSNNFAGEFMKAALA